MQQRPLGRTGLSVSALGFGCGAVGGLMVRGSASDQQRAVAAALAGGISYFDTAADYGQGASEIALGQALRALGADPVIGTKVRVLPEQKGTIGPTILAAMDASLARLGRSDVHLYQLHNPITAEETPTTLTPAMVEAEVLPAFARLREAGKALAFGFTAIGEDAAIRALLAHALLGAAQVPFNLLNAGAQDPLLRAAAAGGVGPIGIRILAGGALSGSTARGKLGTPNVQPIGSGPDYAADVASAQRLAAMAAEGGVASPVEAAIRFAAFAPGMATALVGLGSQAELEGAIAAVARGPLPPALTAALSQPR